MISRHAGVLLWLSVASNSHAASSYSAQYTNCIDRAGGVTADTIDCIGQELAHQDKRLNQNYQHLLKVLRPERKTELRDVQRLWLKYREANCNFYYDTEGGSLARIIANQCMLDMLIERNQELERLIEQH